MKKLRAKIDSWFDRLDERWQELPLGKQQLYTLYFFISYLLLTTVVILHVWYDAGRDDQEIVTDHIENPVIKKRESGAEARDSLSIILKNKIYERK